MRVVINDKFGGFGLSHAAVMRYAELKGIKLYPFIDRLSMESFGKVYGGKPTGIDDPKVLFISYAFVPEEELYKIEDEENKKPVTPGRYEKTNALYFCEGDIPRDDPILIQVIEELKGKANSRYAKLKIVEIPDDVKWEIEEYDGTEWIAEKHRTWR